MTLERLRELHNTLPFRPFTMWLADGRSLLVTHSEVLAISPAGRTIALFLPNDSMEIIDLLLVTSINRPEALVSTVLEDDAP